MIKLSKVQGALFNTGKCSRHRLPNQVQPRQSITFPSFFSGSFSRNFSDFDPEKSKDQMNAAGHGLSEDSISRKAKTHEHPVFRNGLWNFRRRLRLRKHQCSFTSSSQRSQFWKQEFLETTGFRIKELPGSSYIELTKTIGRLEVLVSFRSRQPPRFDEQNGENDFQKQENLDSIEKKQTPEEDILKQDVDEEDGADSCFFDVYLQRNDQEGGLYFRCVSVNQDVNVTSMMKVRNVEEHKSAQRKQLKREEYTGPEFYLLDERLQTAVRELLDSYGVNTQLGGFIQEASLEKEIKSYREWLSDIKDFLGRF